MQRSVIHPDDVDKVAQAMVGLTGLEQLADATFDVRVWRDDGIWADTESKVSLLYDDDQQLRGIVVNARDVTERKRIEDAFRESEALFRNIANVSPIFIVNVDPNLKLDFANETLRNFLGVQSQQFELQDLLMCVHPDDGENLMDLVRHSLDNSPAWNTELRLRTAQGEYRWVRLSAIKRFDEAGRLLGFVSAGLDIHDLKQTQSSAQESERRFRSIASASPTYVCTLDADFRIEFASQALWDFLVTQPDGSGVEDLLQQLRPPTLENRVDDAPSWVTELRLFDMYERHCWLFFTVIRRLDEAGNTTGYIAAGMDLTAHREARLGLERQVAFNRLLADWSDKLTQSTAETFDTTIEMVLAEFGQFTRMQAVRVFLSVSDAVFVVQHEWIAPEFRDRPQVQLKDRDIPSHDFAWWHGQIASDRAVVLSDVRQLPPELVESTQRFSEIGVASVLNLPLKNRTEIFGQFALDVFDIPREWSDEDIRMGTLVANLIGHALNQRRGADALHRRATIEHIIAAVSGEFARLPMAQIDEGIQFTLRNLGSVLPADACHVLLFNHGPLQFPQITEWTASGLPLLGHSVPIPTTAPTDFVWVAEHFKHEGAVQWTCQNEPAQLSPELKVVFDRMGAKAVLLLPLQVGQSETYDGLLMVTSFTQDTAWKDDEVAVTKLMAETISNALARQQTHAALKQRLAFEQHVAEISSRFLGLPPNQVDQGIDFALKTLGEFTQVSICRLFQYDEQERVTTNTHEWCALGIASQRSGLQNMELLKDTWWQRELRARKLLYFNSISQIPTEAGQFLNDLKQRGVRSITSIPLIHGDTLLGELGLDDLTKEHSWTDDDIRMLRLVGEIITSALVRQRAHARLQTKIAAEELLSAISFDFVRQPLYKVGETIAYALQRLGTFAKCDFCSLYEIAEAQDTWSNTYEWHADSVAAQLDLMQKRPFERDIWWWAQLAKRQNIILQDVTTADQPEGIRQDLMSRGIRSLMAIPILQNGILIGELGLDMVTQPRHWSPDLIQIAELVADLIGSAIERKRNAHALQMERDLLEARVIDRTHELTKLLEVTKTVNATLELQPLLNLILDQLKGVVAYDALTISEFNESNSKVIIFEGSPIVRQLATDWAYDVERDVHITEMIVNRKAVIVADVLDNSSFAIATRQRFVDLDNRLCSELQSLLYVPLIVRDRVIGLLALYSHTRKFYTEHHARLAMAFANQVAVAIENARLHEQAVQMAALTERSRLARELHDSVSQALFGIVLGSRTVLQNGRRTGDTRILEPMEYVLTLSEAALAEMRALIFELRPESLQQEGLLVAFQKQSEAICARHRIGVKADLGNTEPPAPLAVKEALYRIGLEALQNTIKHANATQVELNLRVLDEYVVLEVKDNGRGFDPRSKFPGHFGLHTMRERAEQFGGSLDLISIPQEGTLVQVRMPLSRERLAPNGQQALAL